MKLYSREKWETLMPEDMGKNNCPFCTIAHDEYELYIWESKHWQIRHNKYPYLGLKNHLLVIHKQHRKYTHELSAEEYSDYHKIDIFMKEYYNDSEYFSFIRQSLKGRSLEHLHYHYLPGHISGPDIEYILQQNLNHQGKA